MIAIPHRWKSEPVYISETATTRREAVIEATRKQIDLSGAYLIEVDLSEADLSGAYLIGADLSGADLSGADLSRADLSRAKNAELAIARTVITPAGDLHVYKRLREGVAKLEIPADAKRSSACGRKCRAEFAVVLELPEGCELGHSMHDQNFTYRVGETVRPTNGWKDDRWQECAPGIHFYLTREEAESHS